MKVTPPDLKPQLLNLKHLKLIGMAKVCLHQLQQVSVRRRCHTDPVTLTSKGQNYQAVIRATRMAKRIEGNTLDP